MAKPPDDKQHVIEEVGAERWQLSRRQGSSCDHFGFGVGKVKKIFTTHNQSDGSMHRSSARTQSHPMVRYSEVPFDAILEVAEL